MATILMGWVTGIGLGHITKLVPLAHALQAQGHHVVLAVEKLRIVADYLRREGLRAIPAFGGAAVDRRPRPLRSFADLLGHNGFEDTEQLAAEVMGWDAILAELRPDLVVTESAFALQLACYERLPVVQIGTGLTVPPHHLESFPRFDDPAELADTDGLLRNVADVQRRVGRAIPARVPALFDGPKAIYGVRELDLHGDARPPGEHGRPTSLALTPRAGPPPHPHVFAYLKATYDGLPAVLGTLGRVDAKVELVCPGLPDGLAELARHHDIVVHDELRDLAEVLPHTSLLVHHGGHGTSQAALMVGCPQLLLARQGEHGRNADKLRRLGVATELHGPKERIQAGFEPFLRRTWEQLADLDRSALAVATTIADRETETAHDHALSCIDAQL